MRREQFIEKILAEDAPRCRDRLLKVFDLMTAGNGEEDDNPNGGWSDLAEVVFRELTR